MKESLTGDILLFTTNRVISKAVRAATASDYDHVAMIIRDLDPDDRSKVHVFEAVGGDGVRIIEWEMIKEDVGATKHYNKVVYRKVDFKREKHFTQLL